MRPHPAVTGRYQVAFGHRRLRAASELGRPVRAVVKQLSDRDLVIAQGQENSARADLSFVERARFARSLEESGYDRETIITALSVDKTTVSRMISVATRIPADIVDAIGPAPGTGRDRWIELSKPYQISGRNRSIEGLLQDPTSLRERPISGSTWLAGIPCPAVALMCHHIHQIGQCPGSELVVKHDIGLREMAEGWQR